MSQSYLKNLKNGIKYFYDKLNEPHKDTEYFLIGSAVDTLLTGTFEEFDEEYYVLEDNNRFSGKECTIVENVYKEMMIVSPGNLKDKSLKDLHGQILIQADLIEYQTKWKTDTRINKIIEKGSEYFELLKSVGNKKVLTSHQYALISIIVSNFKNHIPELSIESEEAYAKDPNKHMYYQMPLYQTINGVECKGLLDMCIIDWDHENKNIYVSIYDIKTTSKRTLDFPKSAKAYGYDVQAATYATLIKKHLNEEAPDYKVVINPVTFLVESTTNPGIPCKFIMSKDVVALAREELLFLIDLYKWHKDNDEWDVDRDLIINNTKEITLEQWSTL